MRPSPPSLCLVYLALLAFAVQVTLAVAHFHAFEPAGDAALQYPQSRGAPGNPPIDEPDPDGDPAGCLTCTALVHLRAQALPPAFADVLPPQQWSRLTVLPEAWLTASVPDVHFRARAPPLVFAENPGMRATL